MIGTDGGLVERPVIRPYVMLAPAERIEIWADFSRYRSGSDLFLQSLPFAAAMLMGSMMGQGMMGGMMNGMRSGMMSGMAEAVPNGAPLTLCRVRITDTIVAASKPLPTQLVPLNGYRVADAVNRYRPRVIRPTLTRMRWGLNGLTFEMNAVAPDERVRQGTLDVWEFTNDRGMGMMGPMAHPMHIHAVQFQIFSREILPEFERAYATIRDGLVDEGWKDTVLVSPGERVRVLVKFQDGPGLFVYHCHNLEHADGGMMRNYRIQGG